MEQPTITLKINKSVPSFQAGITFAHTKYYYNPAMDRSGWETYKNKNPNRSDSTSLTVRQSKIKKLTQMYAWRFNKIFGLYCRPCPLTCHLTLQKCTN